MRFLRPIIALTVFVTAVITVAAQEKLTLDQVIAKHLASIGTPEARAAVKSRVAQGKSKFENVNAGGFLEGKATVVSQENNTRMVLKYPNPDYPGEDMITNGKNVSVYGRPRRSALGYFIYNTSSVLLSDGLLAGALSTSWPLLDSKLHNAKMTYTGLKTIEGQVLHEVHYQPKNKTDVDIRLYFSKDDFRHVLTIATLTLSPRLVQNPPAGPNATTVGAPGTSVDAPDAPSQGSRDISFGASGRDAANASGQMIRYKLEERFSNFENFNGLTLPTNYEIRYDLEGDRQAHQRYTNVFNEIVNNVSLDSKNFDIK